MAGNGFFNFDGGEFRDAIEQGIDAVAHLGFVGPLLVERFLEDVDGLEANIDDGGRRLNFSVAQAANQILNAMRDRAKPLQSDLSCRSLDRVDRAEQAIDLFGIVVAFQRDQAIADDLKMLFGFRLEELQNLGTDFIVKWERVEVGTGNAGLRCFRRDRFNGIANGEIQRNRLDRESETVAFLER
ncbi:MAG TPA: hypothetical protein VN916_03250, partial [Candidatus Acidoferrum sp.]|nr:hypothetical protein [Candidatus Acidoferrum sp.]